MLIPSGIKLVIAMHDRYQLGCWGNGMFIPVTRLMRAVTLTHFIADTYVSKYKLPALDCAQKPAAQNDVTFFYQDSSPIFDFDNRLTHILQHKNQLLSGAPQWKDLSDYIFSFNIQNEGQGHLRNNIAPAPQWWCDRSKKMRSVMGNSAILISTGTFLCKHDCRLHNTDIFQAAATSSPTLTSPKTGLAQPSTSSTSTHTAAYPNGATKLPSHSNTRKPPRS
jgi:hypothetical protein